MIEIENVVYVQGRGHMLCVKPVQNPWDYVGEIWEHKGVTYNIRGWEGMQCLLGRCECIKSLAFRANVLGVEKKLKNC